MFTRKLCESVSYRTLIALITIGGLGWGQAMAQAPEPVASENKVTTAPEARDAGGHWTPETLFEAQLLPLPAPTASLEELTSETPAPQEEEQIPAQVIDNGAFAPEESEVPPDLADKLFSDARPPVDEGPVAEAAGRSGAYFSSSRLVPEDARFAYPYRANGKLFFQKPDGRNFICSGAVIKPRLVLTAGHCVHSGSGGPNGFYTKFLFVPAYHRGQAPYHAWNFRWVVTTGSWATSNDNVPNKADFAIIEVEDRKFSNNVRKIGEVVGWLGFRTNALSPNHTKKIGYPGNHDRGDVMHQVDSRSFKKAAADTVLYGSDMRGGSSGGSWIENFGVKAQGQQGALFSSPNRVVGVTSYGYVDTDPKVQGSSILNDEFIKILNQACAHRPGNC